MATIDLGKIKQVWRGTYNNGTAYTVDDLVEYTDSGITSSYICVANSTGNAPSSGGTAHASWNYMAKGGVAGTTLPSQSGQSGKYLTTNGSSLSFGTVTSDFVKLNASGAVSGTSLSWDNHYTSDYLCYKILIVGLYSGSGNVKFRYLDSSGNEISAGQYMGGRTVDSGVSTGDNNYGPSYVRCRDSSAEIQDSLSNSTSYRSYIELVDWDPLNSGTLPMTRWWGNFWDGGDWREDNIGAISTYNNTSGQATRGGRIYNSSGNTLYANNIIVYGLKV